MTGSGDTNPTPDAREDLERIVEANRPRLEESVRRGEAELAAMRAAGSGDTTPDVVTRAKTALEGVTEGPWLYIPGDDEEASVVSEGERLPDAITMGGVTFNPGVAGRIHRGESTVSTPDQSIECPRCKASPLGGGQCELDAGHDGKHRRTWDDGGAFEWTDESQMAELRRFERGY